MIYIYSLSDPETKTVRYIGKTSRLVRRLQTHIRLAPSSKHHAAAWINSLLNRGLKPEMNVIEEIGDDADWSEREIFWIEHFKKSGFDLTNTSPGGLGGASYGRLGKKNSPEHIAKCSKSRTGVKINQNDKNGKRAAGIQRYYDNLKASGKKHHWGNHSEEFKEKMAALGRSETGMANIKKAAAASAEARRGKPAINRGIPASEETKKKISDAKKGIPWSDARRLAQQQRKERIANERGD